MQTRPSRVISQKMTNCDCFQFTILHFLNFCSDLHNNGKTTFLPLANQLCLPITYFPFEVQEVQNRSHVGHLSRMPSDSFSPLELHRLSKQSFPAVCSCRRNEHCVMAMVGTIHNVWIIVGMHKQLARF